MSERKLTVQKMIRIYLTHSTKREALFHKVIEQSLVLGKEIALYKNVVHTVYFAVARNVGSHFLWLAQLKITKISAPRNDIIANVQNPVAIYITRNTNGCGIDSCSIDDERNGSARCYICIGFKKLAVASSGYNTLLIEIFRKRILIQIAYQINLL